MVCSIARDRNSTELKLLSTYFIVKPGDFLFEKASKTEFGYIYKGKYYRIAG